MSAIFPDGGSARTAERRLRAGRAGAEEVYLLSPATARRDLGGVCRALWSPGGLSRILPVSLIAGAIIGALAHGALVLAGLEWGPGYLTETLAMAAAGCLMGGAAAVLWHRLAIPPSLEPLRQALRHGHWVVVAVPTDAEQSGRARRVVAEVLDNAQQGEGPAGAPDPGT